MKANDAAKIFKALSDETRVSILKVLSQDTQCACQLLEGFSIAQSTLSHHMKMLTSVGLVDAVKKGKWVYYQINEKTLDTLKAWVTTIEVKKHNIIPCESTEKDGHYESI